VTRRPVPDRRARALSSWTSWTSWMSTSWSSCQMAGASTRSSCAAGCPSSTSLSLSRGVPAWSGPSERRSWPTRHVLSLPGDGALRPCGAAPLRPAQRGRGSRRRAALLDARRPTPAGPAPRRGRSARGERVEAVDPAAAACPPGNRASPEREHGRGASRSAHPAPPSRSRRRTPSPGSAGSPGLSPAA
jgi:hypothetical protein